MLTIIFAITVYQLVKFFNKPAVPLPLANRVLRAGGQPTFPPIEESIQASEAWHGPFLALAYSYMAWAFRDSVIAWSAGTTSWFELLDLCAFIVLWAAPWVLTPFVHWVDGQGWSGANAVAPQVVAQGGNGCAHMRGPNPPQMQNAVNPQRRSVWDIEAWRRMIRNFYAGIGVAPPPHNISRTRIVVVTFRTLLTGYLFVREFLHVMCLATCVLMWKGVWSTWSSTK